VTAARWRSVVVAAMFAVHPLAVESVGWASERKNVLGALFWMLAVVCYCRYARLGSRRAYAGALASMAMGLMAKPTLVTLPLVLLALDRWLLGRLAPGGAERAVALLAEKVPFFALSAASSVVTLLALARGDHLTPVDSVPLPSRIANGLWALLLYAGQVVWPARLAVLYPHAGVGLFSGRTGIAIAALGVPAWFAVRHRHSRPYLVTGTLPGGRAAGAGQPRGPQQPRAVHRAAGPVAAAADHFRRALAVDPDHARAHVNVGRALRELGRWDEARAQWREALARWPQDPAVREAREEMDRLDRIRAPR